AVSRAVDDDDRLEVAQALAIERGDRAQHNLAPLVGGDDDREPRHLSPAKRSSGGRRASTKRRASGGATNARAAPARARGSAPAVIASRARRRREAPEASCALVSSRTASPRRPRSSRRSSGRSSALRAGLASAFSSIRTRSQRLRTLLEVRPPGART